MIDAGRSCAWCETILVRKRGGFKRPDIQGRISERMARAIHAKYEQGISARKLGQQLYEVLGYGSPHAAEFAIGRAFKRWGLPRRERIAATVLASTKNGLSPRSWPERRRRRREAGLTVKGKERQPMCEGVRAQYPRKGERCSRPAMVGSSFCFSHDPERRDQIVEIVTAARERIAS